MSLNVDYNGVSVEFDESDVIEELEVIPEDLAFIPHYTWLND